MVLVVVVLVRVCARAFLRARARVCALLSFAFTLHVISGLQAIDIWSAGCIFGEMLRP